MGGPGYSIKGEFAQNGFNNSLKHEAGVLSMARAMHPDSAGSQFFKMCIRDRYTDPDSLLLLHQCRLEAYPDLHLLLRYL